MKLLKPTVVILSVISILLIIGSAFTVGTGNIDFYTSPVFLAAVALFAAVQLACLMLFRFRLRKIGFYLCHFGILVVIAGAFISYGFANDVSFNIPISGGSMYSVVQKSDGTDVDFGFSISIEDFSVEKYEPDYQVYRPDSSTEEGYSVYLDKVSQGVDRSYHLGDGNGVVTRQEAMENGVFRDTIQAPNGLIMMKRSETDKKYTAQMKLLGGNEQNRELVVNQPVTYQGWKFYLMDYDHEEMQFVSMYAKKDPGNLPITVGIWMILAGTAMMCFKLFEKKGEEK